jgi:AraC-like DNA-binding protein
MAIYLELPKLNKSFPYRCLENDGRILTTPHWHKEVEIILIVKGNVNFGVNDRPVQLRENEAVIIPGGDIHYVLASPGSERLVFQFDLSIFNHLIVQERNTSSIDDLLARTEHFSSNWPEQARKKIIPLLHKLYKESVKKEPGYTYAIQSLLYRLVTILYRDMATGNEEEAKKRKSHSHEILEQLSFVFQYIEKNYTHSIKLGDISKAAGFSTTYFAKFFKKHTGKTFVEFLNEYRIDKAKWMLINGDLPVSEIAQKVGFSSAKTFYRLFKNSLGIAPLKFKASHLQNFK